MLSNHNGKLLIYTSSIHSHQTRLRIVGSAARKIAQSLGLDLEIIRFRNYSSTIHVYYKNGNDDEIPLYSAKDEVLNEETVYKALRNMIFVLSFHPRYPGLKKIQREVMKLS